MIKLMIILAVIFILLPLVTIAFVYLRGVRNIERYKKSGIRTGTITTKEAPKKHYKNQDIKRLQHKGHFGNCSYNKAKKAG